MAPAPPPGCRNSSGASSTRRSSGITRTSSGTHSSPSTTRSPSPTTRSALAAWQRGQTGYPIVDAAMRQLNATGYMHNRLRMIAAQLPGQGPAGRLAPGREVLRRHADRLRSRLEQRRLAVGGVDRLRRAAVLPHLQPGHAIRALRSRRQVHPPLRARGRGAGGEGDPRAVARRAGNPAGEGRGRRPRLPGADRRSRSARAGRRWRCFAPRGRLTARAPCRECTRRRLGQSSSCLRCFWNSVTSCCCSIGGAGS